MKHLIAQILPFFRSLRLRLGVIIFLFAVIPSALVLFVYSNNYESRQVNSLTVSLTSQAQLISSQIVSGGYLEDTSGSLSNRLNSLREMFVGRIMIMDSSLNILIDTYDIYEGKVFIWKNAIRSVAGETVSEYDSDNNILTVLIPIGSGEDIESGNISGVVLVSRNIDYILQDKEYYDTLSMAILAVVMVLALIVSILASFFLIKPVDGLLKGIRGLSEETISQLDSSMTTEINEIVHAVNEFSDKQRTMDVSVKDFLSNVSHELKTPLTSMKILADSLMADENTPVDFYKEFMGDIASEIDRETAIINDLIGLVRTEGYVSQLNLEPININEMMESLMRTLSPIAEKAHVELVLETFKPIIAEVDTVKFSQAMINLIENAIKYNREDGYVHVSVNSDSKHCFIRVEDNGIGIPKESLDQIFERFYRVDTSHSKEIEGTGLGLSIVKNIILQHNGQIKADSIEGEGTTFTVRIPLVAGQR